MKGGLPAAEGVAAQAQRRGYRAPPPLTESPLWLVLHFSMYLPHRVLSRICLILLTLSP